MSAHVVVVGGGCAGLRAAVALADEGVRVTVLESRAGLGGRARSFTDPATGEVVDNGQHLFLSAYDRTLAFLKRLGTADRLIFQDRLQIRFVRPDGKRFLLDCPRMPAPLHLFWGMCRLPLLTLGDRLALGRLWREVTDGKIGESRQEETVEEWLTRLGQSPAARKWFWRPLTVAVLNEEPGSVSSVGLRSVLQVLLRRPWGDARLGMACVGLSDLYAQPARSAIESAGGEVLLNRTVTALRVEQGVVRGVRLAGGSDLPADAFVSALPPTALLKILPREERMERLVQDLRRFSMSPIISVNLWLDRPVTSEWFTALLGARFQWIFNKGEILKQAGIQAQYVSLIASAAYELMGQSNEEVARIALEELRSCFPPAREGRLIRSQVVREREATVSLTVGTDRFRPGAETPLENFYLAGDWTATGLPATIESAVVSGENCARALLKRLRIE